MSRSRQLYAISCEISVTVNYSVGFLQCIILCYYEVYAVLPMWQSVYRFVVSHVLAVRIPVLCGGLPAQHPL